MERFELYNKARKLASAEMQYSTQLTTRGHYHDVIKDHIAGLTRPQIAELFMLTSAIVSNGDKAIERAVILGKPGLN